MKIRKQTLILGVFISFCSPVIFGQGHVDRILENAKRGYAPDQFVISERYHNGTGTYKQDDYEAIKWCRKSAIQGHNEAQYRLGFYYRMGRGVKKDLVKAIEWFEKSAAQYNRYAMSELGRLYSDGKSIEPIYERAIYWLEKYLEILPGEVFALRRLGDSYKGLGDYEKHFEYYLKAAEAGDKKAQFKVGMYYRKGEYVEKDLKKSFEWLQRGSDDKMRLGSKFQLAYAYEMGWGTTKDLKLAKKLYRECEEKGHPKAKEAIKRVKGKMKK